MDAFDFEQLSKDIATNGLKDAPDVPAAAAEMARKMIVSAVTSTQNRQDPHKTVADVCKGTLGGALLLEKELPPIAIALLGETATIANEVALDPMDMMTWAMEGIAPVCKLAGAPVESAVQDAIEARYMGAGEAFANLCRSAGA